MNATCLKQKTSHKTGFNLDSLRVGDHFFYRCSYERQTRRFNPVEPPTGHMKARGLGARRGESGGKEVEGGGGGVGGGSGVS